MYKQSITPRKGVFMLLSVIDSYIIGYWTLESKKRRTCR